VTIRRDLADMRRKNDGERREAWSPLSKELEFPATADNKINHITYPELNLTSVPGLAKRSLATPPKVLPADQTGVSATVPHELDNTEGSQPDRTGKQSQSSMVLPTMVPPSRVLPNRPVAAPASDGQEASGSSVVETTSIVQPAVRDDHSRSSQRLSSRLSPSAAANRLSLEARARVEEGKDALNALKNARMPTKQELKARWDARPTAQDVKDKIKEFFSGGH
jgi:hypothetical protein